MDKRLKINVHIRCPSLQQGVSIPITSAHLHVQEIGGVPYLLIEEPDPEKYKIINEWLWDVYNRTKDV